MIKTASGGLFLWPYWPGRLGGFFDRDELAIGLVALGLSYRTTDRVDST